MPVGEEGRAGVTAVGGEGGDVGEGHLFWFDFIEGCVCIQEGDCVCLCVCNWVE